jgi:aminopeptidase N
MFGKIAGFEFRYQIRQPVFWVAVIAFFLLPFALTTIEQIQISGVGAVHKNSPYSIGYVSLALTLFYMFISTAFVANVVVRDEETGFGPIIRSTGVGKYDYLIGRFAGAFAAAALGFAAVPLGIFAGSLMPWLDPETLGPNHLSDYLRGYALALPTVLTTATLFFAVATVLRSMMATYVALVAFLVLYTVATTVAGLKPELQTAVAIGEPFGFEAFSKVTRYWTTTESNSQFPALTGPLLWNRLLWLGISMALLATAAAAFRVESRGAKPKKQQKLKALADAAPAAPPSSTPLPEPRFTTATARAQLFARTRFEMGQVFKSPAYFVLLALGVFNAAGAVWFMGELYGTEIYPVTRKVIEALLGSFTIIPPIIAVYYAGELVWRERDRKMHEIVDATAVPDWAFILPKTLAIVLVLCSTMMVGVATGVAIQAARGYTDFEFGKYLVWYILPETVSWALLAVLAIFVQAISPHKFWGWGLMLLYVIANIGLSRAGFEHKLYHYGAGTGVPLSDMNGLGRFWQGAWWFKAYWTAFALILLVVSYGLWRRGTETRLAPRLARFPRRLAGPAGAIAAAAAVAFVGLGGFIYLNTNVWNEYRTTQSEEKRLAAYEKALLPYEKLPQPSVVSVKLDVDLYPHEPRVQTRGEYVIENRTGAPLKAVHLRMSRDLKLLSFDLPGARLEKNYEDFNYRIYRLDRPMAPGERRTMTFETRLAQRGFRNTGNGTRIVDNGAFLDNSEFTPSLGMSRSGLLQERAKRRKYGLPPELRMAKLEDDGARARNYADNAGWVLADITVTTDADQTPVAPGYKVRDEVKGGRRTAEFRTDAPVLDFFSVQSARYLEKHETYKGVDIGVYYDRRHPQNVDRMITAAKAGLDYFQAEFSPYQFRQIRFLEFPAYADFAQSFANTVPWSEGLGFIARADDPEKIDYVTYIGAHELGHQWWAHQVIGADMQGSTALSETLAQYSALMVMEKMYGPEKIQKFLKYELDRYLRGRGSEVVEELPLGRVENQPYIHYRKGSLVMYLLKDQIGEAAVNRALRRVLDQYAFKGAPYPTSRDLVAALRAEAPADKQGLITDLFERITLYDVKAQSMTVRPRKDGRFDVALTVKARKLYADGKGKETEAPIAADDSFDVGLFAARPGKKDFGAGSVILFERRPLKSGTQVLRFVTDRAPKFGGADPYNKRIDRDSDDNVVQAG